jgi:hypothetical protein
VWELQESNPSFKLTNSEGARTTTVWSAVELKHATTLPPLQDSPAQPADRNIELTILDIA